MLCSWEGNCRSGITLAMRFRFSGLSTFRSSGLDREMRTFLRCVEKRARFTFSFINEMHSLCVEYSTVCQEDTKQFITSVVIGKDCVPRYITLSSVVQ